MSHNSIESDASYSGEVFRNLDLTAQNVIATHFSDCHFTRCDFSNAALQQCRFIDCTFEDCALRMTNVEDTTFAGVRFTNCNLLGVDWTAANWSEWATKLSAMVFEGCDLKYGVFLGVELKKTVMKDCNAQEVNFAEADLTEADFSGTDFAGAIFLRTDLSGADFARARNYTLSLKDNKTKGAKFSLPEAARLLFNMGIVIVDPETRDALDADELDQRIE